MRLYSGKIPVIAQEIVKALTANDSIETEAPAQVVSDLEAVLKEYLRTDRAISEEARDKIERHGTGSGGLTRVKAQLAAERNFPAPDEFLPYILQQLMEMLFHSANVEEVFAEDTELRKLITPILSEGTAAFEIEYQKLVDQMKRKTHLA